MTAIVRPPNRAYFRPDSLFTSLNEGRHLPALRASGPGACPGSVVEGAGVLTITKLRRAEFLIADAFEDC
jgi:hypothetical protein